MINCATVVDLYLHKVFKRISDEEKKPRTQINSNEFTVSDTQSHSGYNEHTKHTNKQTHARTQSVYVASSVFLLFYLFASIQAKVSGKGE